MNELMAQTQYAAKAEMIGSARRMDITLRQNIDEQIKQAENRLQELHDTRDRLEKSGILDTRIDDLSRAMRF